MGPEPPRAEGASPGDSAGGPPRGGKAEERAGKSAEKCAERSAEDGRWMGRALELARKGLGRTSPNPAVGAVVVSAGVVSAGNVSSGNVAREPAGEGFHESWGGAHAEVKAISSAGERARGGTLYVTLEPCRHEGKTPPCTDAILDAGIARLVYAAGDPNPQAAGGGAALREKGVEVLEMTGGARLDEARDFYAYYLKHVKRKEPFVTAKWAMTADGRLASRTGDSKWVTSDEARAAARRLRAESDAVIVGVGTVLRDDPKLTARTGDGREPLRVVIDSALRTPPGAELFAVAGAGVLIAAAESAEATREEALKKRGAEIIRLPAPGSVTSHRVDIKALLQRLYERGRLRLLVEGGGTLLGAFFDARRVDEVRVFVAPKVVGGRKSPSPVAGRGVTRMADALDLRRARWEAIGEDIVLRGRVGEWDWMG